jgi:hypothetical protein
MKGDETVMAGIFLCLQAKKIGKDFGKCRKNRVLAFSDGLESALWLNYPLATITAQKVHGKVRVQ